MPTVPTTDGNQQDSTPENKPLFQIEERPLPAPTVVEEKQPDNLPLFGTLEPSTADQLEVHQALVKGRTPDQALKIYDTSKMTGIPADYVADNLDELGDELDKGPFNIRDYAQRSPRLATWMAKDANNFALIKPEVENSAELEHIVDETGWWSSFEDSLIGGVSGMSANLLRARAAAFELQFTPFNAASKLLGSDLRITAPNIAYDNPITQFLDKTKKEAEDRNPFSDGKFMERVNKGDGMGAAKVVTSSIISNAPQLLATIFGGPAGLVVAGASAMGGKAKELRDEGVDVAQAAPNAAITGATEVVSEKLGTLGIVKRWEKAITKNLGKQAWNEIAGNVGKLLAASFIQEATEEGATEVANAITDKLTGVDDNAFDGIGNKVLNASILGGFSGAGMVSPAGAMMGYKQHKLKMQVDAQVNAYVKMGDNAESSKLLQANPAAWKEQADAILAGTPMEHIYMPVEKFKEFFQSDYEGGLSKAISDLGVIEEYNNAVDTNGLVKIKTSEYIAKVRATDVYVKASNDITYDPAKPTRNEEAQSREETKKAIQAMKDLGTSFDPSVLENIQVKDGQSPEDQVYNQLVALGMNQKDARANAVIYRFFDVQAKESGTTPQELFSQYGLRMVRGNERLARQVTKENAPQVLSTREIYGPTLKKIREGKSVQPTPKGKTLFEAIRGAGGFKADPVFAGELKSLPKSLKNKNGLELDALRTSLVESGYLDEGTSINDLIDLMNQEASGKPIYPVGAYDSLAEDQQMFNEEQRIAAILKDNGYDFAKFNAQIDELNKELADLRTKRASTKNVQEIARVERQINAVKMEISKVEDEILSKIDKGLLDQQPQQDGKVFLQSAPTSDIGHKREKTSGRYVGAPDWVGSSPQQLTKLRQKLKKLAIEGEPGRFWYENSSKAILSMTRGDRAEAEKLVSLIAIYSPNATVPANTTMALTAWYQYKAGLPIQAGLGENNKKAELLLRKGEAWSGIKTNSFYQNLMVEIDPSKLDEGVATMDMWMAIAFDYGMKTLDQGPKYKFTEREINRLADELGWSAHQVQASIWTAMKGRVDPIREKLKEEELKLGIGEFVKKKDPETGKVIESYRYKPEKKTEHFRLAHKLGMEYGLSQEAVQASKYDFSNALDERAAQISYEATPGETTGVLPGIHSAPTALKFEYLQDVAKVLNKDGKDIIADLIGLPSGRNMFGVSAWKGQTGAGAQLFVPVPSKGSGKQKSVKPEARGLLNAYAAALGYVLEQEAVVWHIPVFDEAAIRSNGRQIETARPLTEEEVKLFYAAMRDKFNTQELAPGYIDSGLRILNFVEGLDNKTFQKGLDEVIEAMPEEWGGGITDSLTYRSDGEYVSNDWKEQPNAEGYKNTISASGSPDILARLASIQADIKSVQGKYISKYGWDKSDFNQRTEEQLRAEQDAEPKQYFQGGISDTNRGNLQSDSQEAGLPNGGRLPGGRELLAQSVWQNSRTGQSLVGLPSTVSVDGEQRSFGSDNRISNVAAAYMESAGLPYNPVKTFRKVDKARAKKIADAFQKMAHNPNDPKVKAAYEALSKEVIAQWQMVKQSGLKVEFIEGKDPYGNPRNAIKDITENNHMWVFPTDNGFGSSDLDVSDNPLLQIVEGEEISGKPVRVNDLFRIVHDYFGHAKEGVGFRADGEENAWRIHSAMFSKEAQAALTTETRGQNSWVNFGPYAGQNILANPEQTIYAPQKVGILPDFALSEGLEDDKKVLKEAGLFQQRKGANRGKIMFNEDGTVNIHFLENADSTTFLHESAHFFLEVLGDLAAKETSSYRIKSDYEKILKYLGVESRDQIQTAQHEKWAESFEKYLMEGKSPARALNKAFASFKSWMYAFYKSLTKQYPNVKLSDDIRGIFDRMLASDTEIAEARDRLQFKPMLLDTYGIAPDEEGKKYNDLVDRERSAAEDELRGRLMSDLSKQAKEKKAVRRKSLTEEVTKTVESEPDQRAYNMIKNSVDHDGLPAGDGAFKISRELAKQVVSKDILDAMPSGVFDSNGSHPDIVASLVGAGLTGGELLESLSQMEKKNDRIDRLVQEQLNVEFPDPMLDPDLVEQAETALHNEFGSERRVFELDWMVKNSPKETMKLAQRIAGRNYASKAPYRNRAEIIIGQMNVRDIRPSYFKRSEVKAANMAMEAFKNGDFNKAIEYKAQELTNYELYKLSRKIEQEMERSYNRFNKAFQSDAKVTQTRDIDLVNAARALLARVGFEKSDKKPEEYLESLKNYANDVDQYNAMLALSNSAKISTDNLANATYNEFVAVKNAFDAIWDLAKNQEQINIDGKKMTKYEAIESLGSQMALMNVERVKLQYSEKFGLKEKVRSTFLSFKAQNRRIESWVDMMDMGNINGPFRKYFYEPVSQGVTEYKISKAKYMLQAEKLVKDHTKGFSQDPIISNLIGLPDRNGNVGAPYRFENKAELLGAMIHIGNESNLYKLLIGNKWGSVDENGNLDTSAWDAFINKMQSDGILTKADYDFLQSYWNLMEDMKPAAQRAHKEIYGYEFAEVTSKEFITPWGKYKGGYAPAVTNSDIVTKTSLEQQALEQGMTGANLFPANSNGFTKSRIAAYAEPLSMNLNLVTSHIDTVLRFTHITPRMKDVSKLIFDKQFRKRLDNFDPAIVKSMIIPWLDRSVRQTTSIPTTNPKLDWVYKKMRTNVGAGTMFGNILNTLQQYTGVVVAASKVSPKHLARATLNYATKSKEMAEEIANKSKFMETRMSKQMNESAAEINNILVNPNEYQTAYQFFHKNAYILQELAQNQVDSVVWYGAYTDAQEKGLNEDESVRTADAAVRLTQGSMSAEDVSSIEAGTPLQRLFTMFSGYFNMLANLTGSEFTKIIKSDYGLKTKAQKSLYIYLTALAFPAALSGAIMQIGAGQGIDADDDDDYLDDIMRLFFGETAKTAIAMVPYGGQMVMAGVNRFNKNPMDDRVALSPAFKAIEGVVGVPYDIYHAIDKGKVDKNLMRDSLTLITLMSGIPVQPIGKPIGYLMDVKSGKAKPEGNIDFARGLVTGRNGQKL